jgi:hypothetical protein
LWTAAGTWRKLSPQVRRNHSLYVLKYGTMQLMKIFVCTSQSIQKRCVKRSTTTNIQNSSASSAAKNRQCLLKETFAMLCLLYKTLAMLCLLIRLNTTSLGLFLMCPLFALRLQVVLVPAHAVQIQVLEDFVPSARSCPQSFRPQISSCCYYDEKTFFKQTL